MIPIVNADQLYKNLGNFESGLNNPDRSTSEAYKGYVKRGICFVPYAAGQSIHFAPSRFIGYVDNELKQHASESKHGKITNDAISKVLKHDPGPIPDLENAFVEYCRFLGFEAQARGQFGKLRRYWLPELFVSEIEAEILKSVTSDSSVSSTEREQVILARIGQGQFRKDLISFWGRCPLTNVDLIPILRASHIKPWCYSMNSERVDPYNGILLAPNMDALFDKGFISFDDDGLIILSPKIDAAALKALGGSETSKLELDKRHLPFLAFHRAQRLQA